MARRLLCKCPFLIIVTWAAMGWHISVLGQAPGGLQPWKHKVMPNIFTPMYRSFPRLSHGYFIAIPRTLSQTSADNTILVTAADGSASYSIPLPLVYVSPTAASLRLADAAVLPNLTLIVAGSYTEPTGGPSKIGNFVATIDMVGNLKTTINLGTFLPERICAADDGTVWALGQVQSKEMVNNLKYDLMRHYTAAGAQLGSYLPRTTLAARWPLDFEPKSHGSAAQVASLAYLTCGAQSVGAYIGAASTWFEIDELTGASREVTIDRPGTNAVITGLTLLASQSVYASIALTGASTAEPGLYKLSVLGSGRASWVPLNTQRAAPQSDSRPNIVRITGRDDDSIVVVNGRPLNGRLAWIKP